MIEELGQCFSYSVEAMPSLFMRHERKEASPGNPTIRIFALGYRAQTMEDQISLSPRHTEYLWVDLDSFNPEDYFTGGWLEGVKEYLRLNRV